MLTAVFIGRALISGILVAVIAFVARKSPGFGGLIASIPLVSTLAMIWLWSDSRNERLVADYALSTFVYFLPSVPMFLIIPLMLRNDQPFWLALGTGIGTTVMLYLLTIRIASAWGLTL